MGELNLRRIQELREHENLSEFASFSDKTLGRDKEEEPCDIRTAYQRDRDRIVHCKAFRRLMHKTQVFLAPKGDHYRTRLLHTLEVSQNARTIARALRLNEDLTEAIALGHDLGHTPFGHAGERALNKKCLELGNSGFKHSEQSVRILELLEKQGKGLNLTREVRDGVRNHRTSGEPATLEGKVVRFSDKIAYVNHDIDDAIRAKIIREKDIPKEFTKVLGNDSKKRLNKIIHDIIINSEGKNDIIMSDDVKIAFFGIRGYLFENVYTNSEAKDEEGKAEIMLGHLFDYYYKYTEQLPEFYYRLIDEFKEPIEKVICDYISGMTDRYAIDRFQELSIPFSWKIY